MELPYFYVPELNSSMNILDEINSKHVVTVLRMKKGEELLLTDGKGKKAQAIIVDDHRKKCVVQVTRIEETDKPSPSINIGISLLKNTSRLEWFMEKSTELGITEIFPLICDHTEKEHFKEDRMQHILISAMLQSQQSWMPVLHPLVEFRSILNNSCSKKLIAYCGNVVKKQLRTVPVTSDTIILIGPEGDFSIKEFTAAIEKGYQPITLGDTRLRTETAGIVAAALLSSNRN
jgi:16S rRNA (uracil1498-N3)-methyltransferase